MKRDSRHGQPDPKAVATSEARLSILRGGLSAFVAAVFRSTRLLYSRRRRSGFGRATKRWSDNRERRGTQSNMMDSSQKQSPRLLRKPIRVLTIIAIASGAAVFTPLFPAAFRLPFLLINLAAFAMFAVDKMLARTGQRRIPEAYLHVITFAGGFVGSQVGRLLARHKTKKWSFDVVFTLAWICWMATLAVLLRGR